MATDSPLNLFSQLRQVCSVISKDVPALSAALDEHIERKRNEDYICQKNDAAFLRLQEVKKEIQDFKDAMHATLAELNCDSGRVMEMVALMPDVMTSLEARMDTVEHHLANYGYVKQENAAADPEVAIIESEPPEVPARPATVTPTRAEYGLDDPATVDRTLASVQQSLCKRRYRMEQETPVYANRFAAPDMTPDLFSHRSAPGMDPLTPCVMRLTLDDTTLHGHMTASDVHQGIRNVHQHDTNDTASKHDATYHVKRDVPQELPPKETHHVPALSEISLNYTPMKLSETPEEIRRIMMKYAPKPVVPDDLKSNVGGELASLATPSCPSRATTAYSLPSVQPTDEPPKSSMIDPSFHKPEPKKYEYNEDYMRNRPDDFDTTFTHLSAATRELLSGRLAQNSAPGPHQPPFKTPARTDSLVSSQYHYAAVEGRPSHSMKENVPVRQSGVMELVTPRRLPMNEVMTLVQPVSEAEYRTQPSELQRHLPLSTVNGAILRINKTFVHNIADEKELLVRQDDFERDLSAFTGYLFQLLVSLRRLTPVRDRVFTLHE